MGVVLVSPGLSTSPPDSGPRAPTGSGEWVLRVASILVIVAFMALTYSYSFVNGVCCADDAAIAVTAKNVANGTGYASSVSFFGVSRVTLFDAPISTGPTLVLPAALLIRIVGNTPWAPGAAAATVSFVVLLIVFLILKRWLGATRSLLFVSLFLVLSYFVSSAGFVQWYGILGEIPAALLTIAAAALLVDVGTTPRGALLAGLLLGASLNAKSLALLAGVPLVALFALRSLLLRRTEPGTWVRRPLLVVAGYLTLPGLFEVWKLSVLGWPGYLDNVRAWWHFFRFASGGNQSSGVHSLGVNLGLFTHAFGVHVVVLFVVVVVAAVVVLSGRSPLRLLLTDPVAFFFVSLAAASAVNLGWYLLVGPDNARYALIGVSCALAAITTVVLSARKRLVIGLTVAATIALLFGSVDRVVSPVRILQATGWHETERLQHLRKAAAYLEQHPGERRFIGSWWASVGDLEYMLPTVHNFDSPLDLRPGDERGRLLVRNRFWSDLVHTSTFSALERECSTVVLEAFPYRISRCPPR